MRRIGEFGVVAGACGRVVVGDLAHRARIVDVEHTDSRRQPSAGERGGIRGPVGGAVVRVVCEQRTARRRGHGHVLVVRQIDFQFDGIHQLRTAAVAHVEDLDAAGSGLLDGEHVGRAVVGDGNMVLCRPAVGPRDVREFADPGVPVAPLHGRDIEDHHAAEVVGQVQGVAVGAESETVHRQSGQALPDDPGRGGVAEVDGADESGGDARGPIGLAVGEKPPSCAVMGSGIPRSVPGPGLSRRGCAQSEMS